MGHPFLSDLQTLTVVSHPKNDETVFRMGHPRCSTRRPSRFDGEVGDAFGAKDAAIAIHFFRRTHGLGVVIRELHGGPAFHFAELANQADGVEAPVALRIAVAKIIREERAPSGAEADARFWSPPVRILKICAAAKIYRRCVSKYLAAEIRMKGEDAVHVERIGGDEPLAARIAAARREPGN